MPRFSDEQLRILAMDYGPKTSVPQLVQEIKDLREVVQPLVEALEHRRSTWHVTNEWLERESAALAKAKSQMDLC